MKKPVVAERRANIVSADRQESQRRGVRAFAPGVFAVAEAVLEGPVEFAKVVSLRSVPCANSARSEGEVKRYGKRQQWYGGAITRDLRANPVASIHLGVYWLAPRKAGPSGGTGYCSGSI